MLMRTKEYVDFHAVEPHQREIDARLRTSQALETLEPVTERISLAT